MAVLKVAAQPVLTAREVGELSADIRHLRDELQQVSEEMHELKADNEANKRLIWKASGAVGLLVLATPFIVKFL